MKKRLSTILLVLVFILGLLIMLYPTISNWYNSRVNSYVLSNYSKVIDETTDEDFLAILENARAYNENLHSLPKLFLSGEPQDENYINSLDVLNGMMGYLTIDTINVHLPIYHGTDESVLQKYVGHLEGTSLPTGDVGNNTVITGHTGLPSATLLTDLDEMAIGDTFELFILNEAFTYEVFNIVTVEPHEVDNLESIDGKDVVTLVTCTPYGINSHRLLVQGEQIEVIEQVPTVEDVEQTTQTDKKLSIFIRIPIIILLIIIIILLILNIYVYIQNRGYRAYQKQLKRQEELENHEDD